MSKIDLLNFKRRSYHLDITSKSTLVSLPLSVKEFNAVYSDYDNYKDKDYGLKALSYVANMCHYGSPGNIIGLNQAELRQDTLSNLGLPNDFVETNNIKLAMKVFNLHYSKGIFGLFKELNKSFELTRDSISIVNISLDALSKDIKNQQQLKTDSPDAILNKIKTVMEAITQVRTLTTTLSSDVQSLREIQGILLSEEEVSGELYGGGSIPLSSQSID